MTGDERPTLSRSALEALQVELNELKTDGRDRISARLLEARELGDVTDNAAFETAKHDQALLEGRIARLEKLVKDAVVRDVPVESSVVVPGVAVTVRATDDASIEDSFVVAESEERVTGARVLSPRSPLGQALLGKRVGDRVTYDAPGGKFTYEIVGLKPAL
ncbi:MAG TPA: GreA/GreB family elongation factor [Actinomycetota bacterium]|jgi:transcription elongation factor GreA|nr:GreA/GreB family elongation factor [Actinomycetota bacterium]